MTRAAFKGSLEEILGLRAGSLRDTDSRETIESWSSIADVQILTSITSEFGIEPDAELMEAETAGDLMEILESRGAFGGAFGGAFKG
jgi:acyl carrier protein